MITLHESNITSFPLDNGIGVLSDAIVAYTEEELNGMFEFYMEYDSEGAFVDELKEERIIKTKAQDKLGYQLFRIYSITKNHENDNIIVKAQHITYDLANNFVEKMEANRLTKKQVMEKIGNSTVEPHPFNVTSSNTTTVSSTNLYRTNPLQMIAGMDGSVLQIWGGQIERDNFNLILHDRRGHDDGVKVTYEKNITGLTAEFDISGVITRIFPFVFIEATDDSPERLITVSGKYIDSPHIDEFEVIRTEPIDYSSDDRINTDNKTDAQIRQQLTNVAKNYFKETNNDRLKIEMEVQFAHLWETEEYKDVKVLELVGMGDTVTINHSKLKVDATAIVNYIKYDCIAQVNEEVKLGSVKARLTDNVNKIDTIERKVEQAQTSANQAIVSANGKNTTFYGPDEPFQGMQKGDLWFKVIDGQYHKTYRYDGIEWKEILDKDSQEAKEEARQAQDRADDAVNRANQATADANKAIGQAQAGFDLAQESLGIASDAFEEIEPIKTTINEHSGEIISIKESAIGMQEQITGLYGDVTTLQKSSSRLSARIEKLDIRGYNFITHLPKLWEMGFYGIDGVDNMVPGSKYDSEQLIRLADKYRLEPNTDYVLSDHPEMAEDGQEYIETNLFLHLWNDDGSYSRYLVLNFRNEDHFITFKTTSTETQFSLHVMPTDIDNPLNLNMIHEVFHYKLALGTERSGWTPNLDDTGELVSDVQHFVSEFEATAESLAGRISDNEGNLTTLTATVDGLQTTVSDIDGNVSNLTQLSTTLQTRLSDAEGNINTLTLTSQSMQSTIGLLQDSARTNLLKNSKGDNLGGWSARSSSELRIVDGVIRVRKGDSTSHYGVITNQGLELEAGKTYTLSLDIAANFRTSVLDYVYILYNDGQGNQRIDNIVMTNAHVDFKRYEIQFTPNRDCDDCSVLLGAYVKDVDYASEGFLLKEVQVEEGPVATPWTPSYLDLATQSQITQLSDAINLRVEKGDVINQINLDTSGVLISGKKLILDGDTTVTGQFKVRSANIISLDAGKVTVGDLVGHSLVGGSVIGGYIEQQSGSRRLEMYQGRIDSFYRNKLSMRFGQYKMEFYNEDEEDLGAIYPVQSLVTGQKGLALEVVSDSRFLVGPKISGVVYPSIEIDPTERRMYVAGPYSGARTGAKLELYANRRHLSHDVDFTSYDQPAIILDQSDDTNDMTQYFGGTNRRSGAVWQVRWRSSVDSSALRLEANSDGVVVQGSLTNANGERYYLNNSGGGDLTTEYTLRAGGIRTLSGNNNFYVGVPSGGELRVTSTTGTAGSGITYRDARARNWHTSSSIEYKTNIKHLGICGLEIINDLEVVEYDLIDNLQNGIDDKQVGFISEHNEIIATRDKKAINLYALSAYNTKAIQELDTKLTDNVEFLKLKIQYLEQKIKLLEAS